MVETEHFGHLNHENVVPAERIKKFMVGDHRRRLPDRPAAYLFAYIADSFEAAVSGDPGTRQPLRLAREEPGDVDLAKGQTIAGEFVRSRRPRTATRPSSRTRRRVGRFRFARLEDARPRSRRRASVYLADTGKAGENNINGALYQMDIDPSDPTQASLTLLLDSDTGDNIRRPDNLDASAHSVVIQEDGGQNRVLVYDIDTGAVRVVARTPNPAWESSGVINAQTLLGTTGG